MIPKVIHYIWLGGKPLPQIAKKCIQSWKKYCPDYTIKRWDESNLDVSKYKFALDAYNSKKFAFAADVMRLDVLIQEGGIYFDIDVELLKPIDDLIESNECFMGFESSGSIAPGLILATMPNNKDLIEILQYYTNNSFNLTNLKQMTICEIFTRHYEKHGLKRYNNNQLINQTMFYSSQYFSPIDIITNKKKVTKNTYSIHWYNASWYTPRQKFLYGLKKIVNFCTFGFAGRIYNRIKNNEKRK